MSGSPIRFTFGYDGAGRLENRWTNGTGASAKVHVNHGFDADGQLTSRTVTSNTAPTLTTVFQDHLTYDARGKIAHATIGSDLSSISSDEWEHLYDGFGALTAAGRNRGSGITADVNSLDALGNVITRVADSTLSSTPKHVDFSFAAGKIFSAIRPAHVIPTDGGGPKDSTRFETYYYHDGNGNQIFEEHFVYEQRVIPTSGIGSFADLAAYGHTWQWMTYGRDNKLRYAQRSSHDVSGHRTVFTEYRYDALGRKVLARHRRDTLCTPTWEWTCHSSIERFLWDGDQLLGEVRFDGADHLSEGSLNTGAGSGPFYGTVRYTHAHGIDEPLAVWGGGSGLYGVVPHLSWRGGYEAGSNIETGALLDDGGTPAWIWPARYRDLNLAPDTRAPNPEPTRWLGSLIEGQVDLSGLAYRRNRYYNPATGRFTQEDPIGLAGGMNLYGFAEGDPVTYSDPFGLKVCFRGSRSEVRSLAFTAKAATNSTFSLDSENCVDQSSFRSLGNSKFDELRELFGGFVGSDKTFTVGYTYDAFSGQVPFTILLGRDTEALAYRTGRAFGKCDGGRSAFMMEQVFAHEMVHHQPELAGKPLPGGTAAEENRAVRRGDNLFNAAVGRRLRCAY